MNLSMHESLYVAIQDYMERHNWKPPAKIVMSESAFVAALRQDLIDSMSFPETYRGIPLSITSESGIHIHLCEPAIHLFPEINENVIRMNKENTDE